MPAPFSRTLRAIEADRLRRATAGLVPAVILLTVWTVWLVAGRVSVYEVSANAALAADREPHPIAAAVAGPVARIDLELGRRVRDGDVVALIDSREQEALLGEQRARAAALDRQIAAVDEQISQARQALAGRTRGTAPTLDEARAHASSADAAATLAEREAERLDRLRANGVVADADVQRARLLAQQRRSDAKSSWLVLARLTQGEDTEQRDRRASVAGLASVLTDLVGQAASIKAMMPRLEREIQLRTIRAPVSGYIGDIARIQVGSVVAAGERFGSVVPDGRVKVIAQFDPASALGRIRPRQHALVHLTGFPSSQYGSLPATVAQVAGEPRDGLIRVDLLVHPVHESRLPLQHGLPALVEVEVERVSPAALVLRSVGRMIERRAQGAETIQAGGQ